MGAGRLQLDGLAHPEIEYTIADGPAPGSWRGLDGLAEGWRAVLSAWDDARIEADGYRELDDEHIFVLLHWSGRGKTSGIDLGRMSAKGAGLFQVRDGRLTRAVTYFNRERAFDDLGLSPEERLPRL